MEEPHIFQLVEWAATSAAAVAAGGSAVLALLDYRRSRRLSDEKAALDAYGECLDAAFAHPEFSSVETKEALNILKKNKKFEAYEWYVAKLLWSFELALVFVRRGNQVFEWTNTIKGQLRLHAPYLASDFHQRGEIDQYPAELRRFISEVVAEESASPIGGAARLGRARKL